MRTRQGLPPGSFTGDKGPGICIVPRGSHPRAGCLLYIKQAHCWALLPKMMMFIPQKPLWKQTLPTMKSAPENLSAATNSQRQSFRNPACPPKFQLFHWEGLPSPCSRGFASKPGAPESVQKFSCSGRVLPEPLTVNGKLHQASLISKVSLSR